MLHIRIILVSTKSLKYRFDISTSQIVRITECKQVVHPLTSIKIDAQRKRVRLTKLNFNFTFLGNSQRLIKHNLLQKNTELNVVSFCCSKYLNSNSYENA